MNLLSRIQNVRVQLILAGLVLAILSACAPTGTQRGTGEYIDDTAYRGTVQLSGFVDSSESALRAAQIARETPGVKEVRNSMVIREPRRE